MSAAFVFPPGSAGSDTLGPQVIAASWLLTSLSGAFLFMRVSAKLWTGRGLLVDDYLLFLAWLAIFVPAIISTVAVGKGLGRHILTLNLEQIPNLALLINITVTTLIFAAALSKMSFAITVLRLVKGYVRVTTWFIMVSTNVFLGVNVILLWVIYNVVPSNELPSPSALSLEMALASYGIAATSYSAAMDFALVAIAWTVVFQLQMRSTREKVGLGVAMSMGVAAGITSLVKAAILPALAGGDITYATASLHIWSMAEPSVTIMAASIPLLRVLFSHVRRMRTAATGATARGAAKRVGYGRSLGGSVKRTTVASIPAAPKGGSRPYDMYGVVLPEISTSDKSFMLENAQEIGRIGKSDGRTRDVERGDRWSEVGDGSTLRSSNVGSDREPQELKLTQYAHTGERLTIMADPYEVDNTQYAHSWMRFSQMPGRAI